MTVRRGYETFRQSGHLRSNHRNNRVVGLADRAGWARTDGHAGTRIHLSPLACHVGFAVHVPVVEWKFYRWLSRMVGIAAVCRCDLGTVDFTLGRAVVGFTKVPKAHALNPQSLKLPWASDAQRSPRKHEHRRCS